MTKFKALGAHVYAGGHTVGVREAGFEVLAHLEEGNFGVETSKKNLGVEVRVGMDSWRPQEFSGRVDWLYTNPPCAAWSMGGTRKHWSESGLPDCTIRCFDLYDQVEPKIFTWECVARAANAEDFQRDRVKFCWDRGYDVHALLFDVADCGLASRRARFFFVATSVVFEPLAPAERRRTPREVWEGLDPGPILPGAKNEVAILTEMPPGRGSLADHFMETKVGGTRKGWYEAGKRRATEGNVRGRPSFMHRRLGWDELGFTVAGGQHLYHPDEPRPITVAEQAALVGYPRGYEFVGRPTSQYAQIGKAVTPPAAKWLGDQVRRALERGEPVHPTERKSTLWDFLHRGAESPVPWYAP